MENCFWGAVVKPDVAVVTIIAARESCEIGIGGIEKCITTPMRAT